MAEVPPPQEEILRTHFIVSDDVELARRFHTQVLGGQVAFSSPEGRPTSHCPMLDRHQCRRRPTDDKPRSPWRRPATQIG